MRFTLDPAPWQNKGQAVSRRGRRRFGPCASAVPALGLIAKGTRTNLIHLAAASMAAS